MFCGNRGCWCWTTAGLRLHLWKRAADTGADLLWRLRTNLRPKHLETLEDGSWLVQIVSASGTNRQGTEPLRVRVITYTIDDDRGNPESYRLLMTILDPEVAGPEDLAATSGSTVGDREHL